MFRVNPLRHPVFTQERPLSKQEHLNALEKKLCPIFKKIFENDPWHVRPSLILGDSVLDIPAIGRKKWVHIPYLFLIKTDDIPENLRISGVDDTQLQSDEYLEKLLRWTEKFIGVPKQSMTFQVKEALRMFMKFLLDPIKSEKAKEFIIAHEMAHLFHKQKGFFYPKNQFIHLLIAAGTMLVAFGLSLVIPYFWMVLVATAVVVGICSIRLFKNIAHSHRCEKEADLTAAKLSREIREGGIYLFETLRNHRKKARENSCLLKFVYSPLGNDRSYYLTHPSDTERVRYLKNIS